MRTTRNVKSTGQIGFTRTVEKLPALFIRQAAPVVHINARGTTLCCAEATAALADSVRQELGEPTAIPVFHKVRRFA